MGFRDFFNPVLSFLFPTNCILCGLDGENIYPLCYKCEEALNCLEGDRCEKCSRPLISFKGICSNCRERSFAFHSHRTLYSYMGEIKKVISEYKFNNRQSLSIFFASKVEDFLKKNYFDFYIVPVPCNPKGLKKRGWDPVFEILGHIDSSLPRSFLIERKAGASQKSQNRMQRKLNVKNRFFLTKRNVFLPKKILLFDDIFTTGYTASECAALLLRYGVQRVDVLSLAME